MMFRERAARNEAPRKYSRCKVLWKYLSDILRLWCWKIITTEANKNFQCSIFNFQCSIMLDM